MQESSFGARGESGSILVVAMMILVVLTIIGIVATNMSTIELNIAGNEIAYKKAFYAADSGVSYVVAQTPTVDPDTFVPGDEITPARRDLDNDGTDDVEVLYAGLISLGPPLEIEVQSNSLGGRGNVSIIAGVRYPTPPGALGGVGDEDVY